MSLCAQCGLQLAGDAALSPHHHDASRNGWAAENRLMCDLLHRGIVPSRAHATDGPCEPPGCLAEAA